MGWSAALTASVLSIWAGATPKAEAAASTVAISVPVSMTHSPL